MNIRFINKENGPKNLLAEAEIEFTEGFLAGTKLVGISIWATDSDPVATLPSRSWGEPGERRFFDLLRAGDGGTEALKAAKREIVAAFQDAVFKEAGKQ